jgi:hypothetical protein
VRETKKVSPGQRSHIGRLRQRGNGIRKQRLGNRVWQKHLNLLRAVAVGDRLDRSQLLGDAANQVGQATRRPYLRS